MDRRLSSSSDSGFKDGTEYNPSRVRITRPTPPKPATNPLQFVKIGPCDLYRSAQEQLKKVEVIKQLKSEKFKDEAEDWQSNLDSWKSTRRKRQERIIERVVEIKNMEQETDKGRRRSKTFSEMLEERNSRRPKLLSMYTEDDNNDLSDLGLSTPSRKGSFSGDSLIDDIQSNRDSDEQTNSLEHQNSEKESNNINDSNKQKNNNSINEKSPDKIEEYTYESAIQGYKSRVERKNYYETSNGIATQEEKEKTNEKRPSLYSLRNLSSSTNEISSFSKVDMPKVDISKRKQLFESESVSEKQPINKEKLPEELSQSKSIKERLIHLQKCTEESVKIKNAAKRLSGDIMTVRERLSSLVMQTSDDSTTRNNMTTWASAGQLSNATLSEPRHKHEDQNKNITESLKESLLRLNNTSNKPENDEEMTSRSFSPIYDKGRTFHSSLDNLNMRESTTEHCNLEHVQSLDALDYCGRNNYAPSGSSTELLALSQCGDTDREDSGIQTADVSCSVSQADEPEEDPEIISALNPARVERQLLAATVNLNIQKTNPPPIKTYLSTIEILNPSCAEDISIKSEPTDKSQQSEDNIVTEELITCTIKPDLKTKPLFEEETLPVENIIGITNPLAPARSMEPPKEKPPPPPVDNSSDDDESLRTNIEPELRRLNSTKRLKNEMRNKRSSFLGIEGLQNDYLEQELSVSKPPDANTILQEELQLEKQLYRRSQSYQHFDSSPSTDLESRDSGVELESRADNLLDSDKAGMSDYDITENNKLPKLFEEDEVTKKEREIIENLIKEEQCNHNFSYCNDKSVPNVNSKNNNQLNTNDNKEHRLPINYQHQDDEHIEDVLKVERELLQLEREELERQRDDMLYQNSKGMKLVNKAGMSLEDISTSQYLSNCVRQYEIYSNYRNYYQSSEMNPRISSIMPQHISTPPKHSISEEITPHPQYNASQMSKHTLHALSATPRSRLMNTDAWIQPQARKTSLTSTSHDRDNYNQHWLIQEAEQRRLSEQKSPIRNNNARLSAPVHEKHIPDTVVQTLTQRLQNRPTVRERSNVLNRNEGDRNGHRVPMGPVYDPLRGRGIVAPPPVINSHVSPPAASINPVPPMYDPHEKMLSVSGKKKCSHCGEELGRGAAMIIESLCLFYHMDCFKCCVCHVQLGDGRMGTDVRVRNHKLHCHNCYSSEDGVKFSCV